MWTNCTLFLVKKKLQECWCYCTMTVCFSLSACNKLRTAGHIFRDSVLSKIGVVDKVNRNDCHMTSVCLSVCDLASSIESVGFLCH
jgi:hypothetical protein